MKNLRQLCAVLVLTLMLTLSAFAGQIEIGYVPPPPQQSTAQGEATMSNTGEISTGVMDTTTEITLNLLQSVLALF